MGSRKKPQTPRSKVRAALRKLWLRSREHAKVLKDSKYCCSKCGIKRSVAKGKEVRVEVHHNPSINWDGIINLIFERILNSPQETLCEQCHEAEHKMRPATQAEGRTGGEE